MDAINCGRETWSFSPSYSGFQSPRLQQRPSTARGPPPIAMLMDCMASSQATCSPQVISYGSRARTTYLAGPQLAQPSTLPSALGSGLARRNQHREMPPWMMSAHAARMKQHRNHEGDLIVSIGTPNQHPRPRPSRHSSGHSAPCSRTCSRRGGRRRRTSPAVIATSSPTSRASRDGAAAEVSFRPRCRACASVLRAFASACQGLC